MSEEETGFRRKELTTDARGYVDGRISCRDLFANRLMVGPNDDDTGFAALRKDPPS